MHIRDERSDRWDPVPDRAKQRQGRPSAAPLLSHSATFSRPADGPRAVAIDRTGSFCVIDWVLACGSVDAACRRGFVGVNARTENQTE